MAAARQIACREHPPVARRADGTGPRGRPSPESHITVARACLACVLRGSITHGAPLTSSIGRAGVLPTPELLAAARRALPADGDA